MTGRVARHPSYHAKVSLLLAGKFLFEACEGFEVTEGCLLQRSGESRSLLGGTAVATTGIVTTTVLALAGLLSALALLLIFEDAAV